MKEMNPVDIAWLAGLMEGEASIGAWKANQNRLVSSQGTKYARVEISSIDPDVIERLIELTGIGLSHKQYDHAENPNHKNCGTWRVAKAEDVLDLLFAVGSYGWFSDHRLQQIKEAIEAASATAARKRSGESTSRKNRRKKAGS